MLYFFFSYSRNNNDKYLKAFYYDLDLAVQGIVGHASVSFFDQPDNKPGDHWEQNLERALSEARVFVAATTASYVQKEYCGKEWAAFNARVRDYAAAQNLAAPPPITIPVLWIPPENPFPTEINSRHYHQNDPSSIPNTKGLRYLTKLKSRFPVVYEDFVSDLARHIVQLAKQHAQIDEVIGVPKLANVRSAFAVSAHSSGGVASAEMRKTTSSLKRVHFVFGAAKPTELRAVGRSTLAAYGFAGGAEWQPYFPDGHTIGQIAQQVASSNDLEMYSEELPLSSDLSEKVRELEKKRQLVVILLDYWTAQIPLYASVLQRFDENSYVNCSVLALRNPVDEESEANWSNLEHAVRSTLYRLQNGNQLFLRLGIEQEAQFCEQLQDVLTRLRAELINKSKAVPEYMPHGGSRPTIAGPGGDA